MRFPLGFGLLLVACSTKYASPVPPTPREATAVSASAGHAWDAVIEQFAARNIPIRTIERVSGLIVTDELSVGGEGASWADCGRTAGLQGPPTHATYNVLVRGDSSTSTVKVTVRWSLYLSPAGNVECFTTNEWEQAFEGEVKARAERFWMLGRSRGPATSAARSLPAQPATRSAQPPPEQPTAATAPGTDSENQDPELPRANAELLKQFEFGVAVVDCTRLGLITSYGEISLGVLVVNLTDGAMTGGSTGFNLANLYDGYRRTVPGDRSGVIELRHDGAKVGEYNSDGLVRSNWR